MIARNDFITTARDAFEATSADPDSSSGGCAQLHGVTELDVDWIHPWIELDWIGWDDCDPVFS